MTQASEAFLLFFAYPELGGLDAVFFRFMGPGLGNMLFPWARSVVVSKKHGLLPIHPTWPQIKIGPILRNENDFRIYRGLFNKFPGEVSGFRKILLLARTRKIPEHDFLANREKYGPEDAIVVFKGHQGVFKPILSDYKAIYESLLSITTDEHKSGVDFDFSGAVSIHVRLGDFSIPESELILRNGADTWRIPIEWYVDRVCLLRKAFGKELNVVVFSDGSDADLSPLLSMPGCRRITFGSSLADLLALSRSKVLLAPGNSTYSLWAAFLGRMPAIYYRGQLKHRIYGDQPDRELECDISEDLPDAFKRQVALSLG